eukprot:12864920-Alexandrium_andersonii.AAC.1
MSGALIAMMASIVSSVCTLHEELQVHGEHRWRQDQCENEELQGVGPRLQRGREHHLRPDRRHHG